MEQHLTELFERDLLKLKDEIRNFKDEENIWHKPEGVSNSAGTLVLHLVGSISYNIGTLIGNTGYVRDRVQEFALSDVPRDKLIVAIETVIDMLKTVLPKLDEQQLKALYPLEIIGQRSIAFYLTYFYGHLNYHLGQVNYLRRILE
ncbi:DinB family protein [Mucilaginibacter sp.]|uniref:DinB family protein n=1 Tax=Mucilaginibacter sp. TaxID=1882438 RepID=UPI003D098069